MLKKVAKANHDRQLRLNQGVDFLTNKIGGAIRAQAPSEILEKYRDDELVDFAVSQFKSGKLPKGVDTISFSDDLAQLMLVKNERDFTTAIGRDLADSQKNLTNLKNAFDESRVITAEEYTGACQQWNLDMALLAGSQIEANNRIQHYYSEGLNEQNRVMMSLEQGRLDVTR